MFKLMEFRQRCLKDSAGWSLDRCVQTRGVQTHLSTQVESIDVQTQADEWSLNKSVQVGGV